MITVANLTRTQNQQPLNHPDNIHLIHDPQTQPL